MRNCFRIVFELLSLLFPPTFESNGIFRVALGGTKTVNSLRQQKMSLDFNATSLRSVLRFLRHMTGAKIEWTKDVAKGKPVTLNARGWSALQYLEEICRQGGAVATVSAGEIRIELLAS